MTISFRLFRVLCCACLMAAVSRAQQLDDQPVEKDAAVQQKQSTRLPTLWIIGDSTVRVGTPGQRGWGDEMASFFDKAKINVVNRAIGGRSSRTFLTDGRWDAILNDIQPGDIVIMQFGHNDAGPINEKPPVTPSTRCRGTIRNNSDDTVDIVNVLTGKPETVHSYGWYLRHYITTAQDKGASAIVCSPIPHKSWSAEGTISRNGTSWGLWARQAAEQAGAQFVDLNEIIARAYEALGKEGVDSLFGDRGTHTSPAGAKLNAQAVLSGLNGLDPNPVAFALSQEGKSVPAFPRAIVEDGRPATPQGLPVKLFAFGDPAPGSLRVADDLAYAPEQGYGWRKEYPNLFAVKLPEGNYTVTLHFRDPAAAAAATVKAEKGRVMLMKQMAAEDATRQFTVNVRQATIAGGDHVRLDARETNPLSPSWDDCLSLVCLPSYEGLSSVGIEPAQDAVTVYLAGDSTVTDQGEGAYAGWGQMLPSLLQPSVAVANCAESGRTLYSFRWEKRLDKILSLLQPQDYVFVQFGHNDQKNKAAGAGPFTTYQKDLEDYVAKVRERNAHIVLISPMERRRWADGRPEETLASYAEAVRQVGQEQQVPVIDLHAMSLVLYAALGEEGSKRAFVYYPPHSFPGQDKELKDNTHHSKYGAYELARCVVQGIRENVPGLAKHIRSEVSPFDPASPDAYDSLDLPLSLATDNERPEGDDSNVPSSAPDGGVVLVADADTCLTNDGNSGPKSTHGREKSMELRRYDGVRQRLLYFRFNLSGITGDLGDARLVLDVASANRPRNAHVYGVLDQTPEGQGESWDETTLTYTDAAGFDGKAPLGTIAVTPALVGPLTAFVLAKDAKGEVTAKPTPRLDAFLKADTNGLVTFVVLLEFSHDVHDFYVRTKETGTESAPRLVLPSARMRQDPLR